MIDLKLALGIAVKECAEDGLNYVFFVNSLTNTSRQMSLSQAAKSLRKMLKDTPRAISVSAAEIVEPFTWATIGH